MIFYYFFVIMVNLINSIISGDYFMPITKFLQEAEKHELQPYKKPEQGKNIRDTHVSFSGSPRKHPHDKERIIIITDPYSTHAFYYEFKISDISYVEELPNIVNMDDEAVTMVRVWVKKKSIGIKCTPFVVEDVINRK